MRFLITIGSLLITVNLALSATELPERGPSVPQRPDVGSIMSQLTPCQPLVSHGSQGQIMHA